MSRFFAVPVLATVLAVVGIPWIGLPSAGAAKPLEIVVSLPQDEPAPAEAPARSVPPQSMPAPAIPAAAPPPAPTVIILEPLSPPAPEVRTEVIERTVYVPQQTVIVAPTTTIVYPPAEAAPSLPQEVVETPVIVVTNPPLGRPLPPARRPKAQQDTFFKEIPFLPPTPQGPRWNP